MSKVKRRTATRVWRGLPSRWDIFKDGISSSLISLWLQCREQFRFRIIEGYYSKTSPEAPLFGSFGHWVLRRAYSSPKRPKGSQILDWLEEYFKIWKKNNPKPSQSQLAVVDLIMAKHRALLPAYFIHYAGDFRGEKYAERYKLAVPDQWIQVEKRSEMAIKIPDGRTVVVVMHRDGVFLTSRRKPFVFDSKFMSRINPADLSETLPFNIQFLNYSLGWFKDTKTVPGVILNVGRRPGLKLSEKENWADYVTRTQKHIKEKGSKYYFLRFQLELLKSDLVEYEEKFLKPVLQDIVDWCEGKGQHYPNWFNLITKYGRCEMFMPITKQVTDHLGRVPAGEVLNYGDEED